MSPQRLLSVRALNSGMAHPQDKLPVSEINKSLVRIFSGFLYQDAVRSETSWGNSPAHSSCEQLYAMISIRPSGRTPAIFSLSASSSTPTIYGSAAETNQKINVICQGYK